MITPKIIFEDQDLIVLDKPAGINVHPVKSDSEKSILDEFRERIDARGFPPLRYGVVHRLDADTSGVMILAKHIKAASELSKQFRERTVEKKYLALVHGKMLPSRGEIEMPIGRLKGSRMSVYASKGKESKTSYRVLASNDSFTFLELTLHTGRTHQIRTHLKAIGFPVVGDPIYGAYSRDKRAGIELQRQFLHSASLSIRMPNGERKEFTAELPGELSSILKRVGLYSGV